MSDLVIPLIGILVVCLALNFRCDKLEKRIEQLERKEKQPWK
jgi:hypothetical protein